MDGRDDMWAVLGLDPGADRAAVRRAHRAAVLATHPDHGGDPEAFRRVQLAFEAVLPLASAAVTAVAPRRCDPYRGFLAGLDAAARLPVAPAPVDAPVRAARPAPRPARAGSPASAVRFAAVLADALAA